MGVSRASGSWPVWMAKGLAWLTQDGQGCGTSDEREEVVGRPWPHCVSATGQPSCSERKLVPPPGWAPELQRGQGVCSRSHSSSESSHGAPGLSGSQAVRPPHTRRQLPASLSLVGRWGEGARNRDCGVTTAGPRDSSEEEPSGWSQASVCCVLFTECGKRKPDALPP